MGSMDYISLRETQLGAAICGGLRQDDIIQEAIRYYNSGQDFGSQDAVTGETFIHLLVKKPEIYNRADRVGLLYLLCCKNVDLDLQDSTGNTALHHLVQQKGVHRMIICLLRCGADPEVRNSRGLTAEDILRNERPEGWEENLHWLQKFLPGIWRAALSDEPDLNLIERLLQSWCRLAKFTNGQVEWLKCRANRKDCSLRIILLLEKYENSIELALAMLSGKIAIIQQWRNEGIVKNVDVNIKDHSYQYGYPDYPTMPRPLLAAVWETNNYDMVSELMSLGPDIGVPFRFEPEAHHKAKPLFFYLLNPKLRPDDERIVRRVLQDSDLCARNTLGQTLLFEAILYDASFSLFTFLLHLGINVAARDRYGRTARDYCIELGKMQYQRLIDEHIINLVADCNISRLEKLVLQGYDHVTDLESVRRKNLLECPLAKGSKQLLDLLNDVQKKQERATKMFEAVIKGCNLALKMFLTRKYACAQDRGGRTVLHHAVEHGHRKLVEYMANEYPQIINIPNNMGQTPLHYAYLFMNTDDTVEFLLRKGACAEAKDVEGWVPADYSREIIGAHAHGLMQQKVHDLQLDLFLSATNFDAVFLQAIRDGDVKQVEGLAIRLRDHGGMRRFDKVLFDCLDHGHQDMACMLIKLGFSTDIYKQYDVCDPDSPLCAMMECGHAMTSFRQQVERIQATQVLQLMNDIAKGKVKLKDRGCCLGRCLRPSIPANSPAPPTT